MIPPTCTYIFRKKQSKATYCSYKQTYYAAFAVRKTYIESRHHAWFRRLSSLAPHLTSLVPSYPNIEKYVKILPVTYIAPDTLIRVLSEDVPPPHMRGGIRTNHPLRWSLDRSPIFESPTPSRSQVSRATGRHNAFWTTRTLHASKQDGILRAKYPLSVNMIFERVRWGAQKVSNFSWAQVSSPAFGAWECFWLSLSSPV